MKLRNNYKRNFQILLGCAILFLFLSYKLAFKKTFIELGKLKKNTEQLALLKDAPAQIQTIDLKLKEIESIAGNWKDQSISSQEILLDHTNKLSSSSRVIINELPKYNSMNKNGFIITNQQIVFQGPFNELLRLLRSLEKDKRIGYICSVVFYNQKEGKSSLIYLKMRVFFQSIKPVQ